MTLITVNLQDILVNRSVDIGLSALSDEDAAVEVRDLYAFLQVPLSVQIRDGAAQISFEHKPSRSPEELKRLLDRALNHARSGDYHRAIRILRDLVSDDPMFSDARRNLGMALLESGQIEEAKLSLVEAIRLFPHDAWGYVLLGNLFAQQTVDFSKAEKCYRKALEIAPDDLFALTSYGGLSMKMGNAEQGKILLRRAVDTGNHYPNAHYNLALAHQREGDPDSALELLDALFDAPPSTDRRSAPVYAESQRLHLELCRATSLRDHDRLMETVEAARKAIEDQTSFPVVLVPDETLEGIQAKAESAWRHHRDVHTIRYSTADPVVVPHLLLHELEHLRMEAEERSAGIHRTFATSANTIGYATRSLREDMARLSRKGYSDASIAQLVQRFITGLASQLYSTPLDMVIESRIHESFPALRRVQLVSLDLSHRRALPVVTNADIKRLTPPFIYDASAALNAAYWLFVDQHLGRRTSFAQSWPSRATLAGGRLLGYWREAMQQVHPGTASELVDRFAATLNLRQWYEWLVDEAQPSVPEGTTNPSLLKAKEPAAVMYCLDSLRRFAGMTDLEIGAIASEIALVGRRGIDYASPDKKYTVSAFPGEQFSGLQMLCFMYVGLRRTNPTMDPGIDLADAYTQALTLFDGPSGSAAHP